MLPRDASCQDPAHADRWEQNLLRLQVLWACINGVPEPAERTTLAILSLARHDERANRRLVDDVASSIATRGFDRVADQVLHDLQEQLDKCTDKERSEAALAMLRQCVVVLVGDTGVSSHERQFALNRLAPALGLDVQAAEKVLDSADALAAQSRACVDLALELVLMLIDESQSPAVLHGPADRRAPGFLGAVDQLVTEQRLGCSRAISYFLSARNGAFWVEDCDEPCAELGALVQVMRARRQQEGASKRIEAIAAQVRELAASDPLAPQLVFRHLIAALGRFDCINDQQRAMFCNRISPALQLDVNQLLDESSRRKGLSELHQHLTGAARPQPESGRGWAI